MTIRKFWVPTNPPHKLGETLAKNFFGTDLAFTNDAQAELGNTNLHYGILHGGKEFYARCKSSLKDFVHVDHGFWGRTDDLNSDKGHFRFSLNSQANVLRRTSHGVDHDRLLGFMKQGLVEFAPRRPRDDKKIIVFQPPSIHMREFWAIAEDFNTCVLKALREKYPTPVVTIEKGLKRPPDDQVWMSVSFNSASMFEALQKGQEAMSCWPVSPWPFESPALDDVQWSECRTEVFSYMAGRTFSMDEMKSGRALFDMLNNGEIP